VQLCAALGMLGLAYVAFFRDGLTFVGSASLAARCPGLLLASSQGTPCRRAAEESSAHAAATASSASFLSGVSTASVALAAAAAAAALKFGGSRRSRSLKPRLSITGCRGAVLNRADKVEESKDKHEDDIECNKVQQAEEGVAPASSREALEQMQTSDAPAADSTSSEAPAAALTSSDASAAQCEEGDKEGDKSNGFSMVFRFAGALWETFVDVATSRSPSDGKKWEYRKGIEGMSLGSLSYEMLTVSKDSADFQELEKVYETGWGVPFVNFSTRSMLAATQDVGKALGVEGAALTIVNVLQTLGVSGDLIDGIPVQNKWIDIVKENLDTIGKGESGSGQRQVQTLMNNMVMGRMERITGAPMPVFLEGYGESEGIYKIVIGPRSVVVISDPVLVKRILTCSQQEQYTKGILSEVLEPVMGKGLIPADPVTWRSRRRAIVPGFHKKWLQETTSLVVDCAVNLCNDLESSIAQSKSSSALVNMEERFTSASLDIIGQAIFDYEFGSIQRESPVIRATYSVLREAERRAQSVIPYWNLPGASSVFRDQKSHSEHLTLLNAVLDELIRKAMKEPKDPEKDRLSLLQYLVITKNEDVTNRQLRDDLMTLLIAGHETTAAMLTWALHELQQPENLCYLQEVKQEVDQVLGGRRPEFEDFAKMPLLLNALMETLRLYPEPPLLIRRCELGDDVKVGPTCKNVKGDTVSILPGQDIFISVWSLHRSKTLWGEDADKFRPHRWKDAMPGKGGWAGYNPAKAGHYPDERAADYAFLPFGAGSRKCIGDNFALLEAQAVFCTLIQRFTFEPAGKPEMTTGATIHTVSGLNFNIARRADSDVKLSPGSTSEATSAQSKPHMEKKLTANVAERIKPEAMVVPTARELRMLFTQQKEDIKRMGEADNYDALEKAYKQCKEVTREHSKTFFLGSQLLEEDEQRVVWAIYNWCRNTDELVDGPEAVNTTMDDLEQWEERLNMVFELQDSLSPSSDWSDLSLADGIRKYSLIQRPFQDMIGGMAMDLVKTRYATFQELEVYCYRVAGTVGVMTLPVLGFDSLQNFTEELQENTIAAAMSLGVALQLTNILRDIGEDARRGRIYVPLEDLARFGITEQEILDASENVDDHPLNTEQKYRDFMEFQMARCDESYEAAKNGIVGLSEVNRLGVMAALYVYGELLKKIRENNYDNLSRRAYVPFADKVILMGEAWLKCQELQQVAEENVRSGKVFSRSPRD